MNSSKCRRSRTTPHVGHGIVATLSPRRQLKVALDRLAKPATTSIRWAKVAQAKAALAAGTYDTAECWDATLDALAERLL